MVPTTSIPGAFGFFSHSPSRSGFSTIIRQRS